MSNFTIIVPQKCDVGDVLDDLQGIVHKNYVKVAYDNTTLYFSCLFNYHQVSGNKVMQCLKNGTWQGTPLYCEVDYYMEKTRLSLTIALVSFLVPSLLLLFDFIRYARRRYRRRSLNFQASRHEIHQRMMAESAALRQALKEVMRDGQYEEDHFSMETIGFGLQKKCTIPRTTLEPIELARKLRERDPSRVWYERDSGATHSKINMFGAGRHLAMVGKKLWDF